jgi:hypothetical protein
MAVHGCGFYGLWEPPKFLRVWEIFLGTPIFFMFSDSKSDAESNGSNIKLIWALVREIWPPKVDHFCHFLGFLACNSLKKGAVNFLIVLFCREFNSLFNGKKIDVVAPVVWIIITKNSYWNPKGLIRVWKFV